MIDDKITLYSYYYYYTEYYFYNFYFPDDNKSHQVFSLQKRKIKKLNKILPALQKNFRFAVTPVSILHLILYPIFIIIINIILNIKQPIFITSILHTYIHIYTLLRRTFVLFVTPFPFIYTQNKNSFWYFIFRIVKIYSDKVYAVF